MMFDPAKVRTLAAGLRFPEGPAVDRDGSVLVPEIEGAALVRVRPDGGREVVAEVGGGANGCAFGPDGAVYVANDGGFVFSEGGGLRFPVALVEGHDGGWLQRVDPATGAVETVFTMSGGERLGGLNDIVFDAAGGCYLADTSGGRLHYADPLAGRIDVLATDLSLPNGAGLSPDGTRLYVSETMTGRVRTWDVEGPGRLVERPDLHRFEGPEGLRCDGLAVDGAGHVCVADAQHSGVRVIDPDGSVVGRFVTPQPDTFVTNLCFGGPTGDTAYVSSGGRGLLYEVPWPWPGLRLNFQP